MMIFVTMPAAGSLAGIVSPLTFNLNLLKN